LHKFEIEKVIDNLDSLKVKATKTSSTF